MIRVGRWARRTHPTGGCGPTTKRITERHEENSRARIEALMKTYVQYPPSKAMLVLHVQRAARGGLLLGWTLRSCRMRTPWGDVACWPLADIERITENVCF
jgi:hypothetical protein